MCYIYAMAHYADALAKFGVLMIELLILAGIGGAFMASRDPDASSNSVTVSYIAAGAFSLFFMIFNLVLCCQWKNFKVAIAIIDASADFFAATKRIILVSVGYFLLTLVVLVVFGIGGAFIVSLNDITPSKNGL
jgi:hypothetical protein